jgi:hypothetical protein
MSRVRNFIHSDFGKYFMSVILGIGISCLFRKVCNDRNCLVFYAAPFDKIKDQIFKYNDKCYTFEENTSSCDKNIKTLEFEKKEKN